MASADVGHPLTGAGVRVGIDGWSVVTGAPVLFRRTALSGALPMPEPGGTLDDLWALINVTEADRAARARVARRGPRLGAHSAPHARAAG